MESLENTSGKLAETLRVQTANIHTVRSVRIAYKRIAMNLIQKAIIACLHGNTTLRDPSLIYKLEFIMNFSEKMEEEKDDDNDGDDDQAVSATNKDEPRVVSLLIYGLLLMCCDSEVKEEAKSILHRVSTPIILLAISYIQKPEKEEDAFTELLRSNVFKEITSQRIGVSVNALPFRYTPPPQTLSASVLFEALIALLCRDFPCVADVIAEVVADLWKTVAQEIQDPQFAFVLNSSFMDYFFLISEKKIESHNWRAHVW